MGNAHWACAFICCFKRIQLYNIKQLEWEDILVGYSSSKEKVGGKSSLSLEERRNLIYRRTWRAFSWSYKSKLNPDKHNLISSAIDPHGQNFRFLH